METISKGHNTTMHVYGVSFQEIDDTVKKAMHAHAGIQNKLLNKSHCSKCGVGRYSNARGPIKRFIVL